MEFDYLVFIGRFEPFHNGHLAVAQAALARAQRLIVLVGSANTPRTTRNPWSADERAEMIRGALGSDAGRVLIRPLRDQLYNETRWVSDVQRTVAELVERVPGHTPPRIGIIGQDKDASSYYLREFPQWPLVEVQRTPTLGATELRRYFFEAQGADGGGALRLLRANVPAAVFAMLEAFRRNAPAYKALVAEHEFLKAYRAGWDGAPYPPTFVTVDAVVVHSGHLLLVRRGAEPGRGQWALPGGFIRPDEPLLDAAIRELREETRLKLPPPVLRGSLRERAVFDHPERSLRGRTITHAFHFVFPTGELPAVRGGDDAAKARWFPVAEALELEPQLFEDHFHIIGYFLGRG
jgi:bifunctional NMN adenylyltransferase/nudix hydrolase